MFGVRFNFQIRIFWKKGVPVNAKGVVPSVYRASQYVLKKEFVFSEESKGAPLFLRSDNSFFYFFVPHFSYMSTKSGNATEKVERCCNDTTRMVR